MNLWERVKCSWLGKCRVQPASESRELIDEMRKSVALTTEIRDQIKDIRKSGRWPKEPLYPIEHTLFPRDRSDK